MSILWQHKVVIALEARNTKPILPVWWLYTGWRLDGLGLPKILKKLLRQKLKCVDQGFVVAYKITWEALDFEEGMLRNSLATTTITCPIIGNEIYSPMIMNGFKLSLILNSP
jgi:hypothetical protein